MKGRYSLKLLNYLIEIFKNTFGFLYPLGDINLAWAVYCENGMHGSKERDSS